MRSLVALVLLASCSAPSRTEAPRDAGLKAAIIVDGGDHVDEPQAHEPLPSRVRLSAEVVRAAKLKTAPVAFEALPPTISLTGDLISDPDRTAKVAARVAGRISDVHAKEGDRVRAGALLVVLESSELARARAAWASAQAKARSSRQNFERLQRVADKGLASGQEVSAAQSDSATLDAEARAARQTLLALGAAADGSDGARMELRAPVSGFVLSRDAVRGQSVTPEHIVFVIADLEKAYFRARLFEKDLARVRIGSAVEVRLNAYPNEVFPGVVETVGRALDPASRTVMASIAVHNRNDLLKVGLFGAALVVAPDGVTRTPRPVVPLSAVTKIAEQDCVFVRQLDGDYEVHKVTLGRTAAGKAEVVVGLRAGEQVVVDGVFTLKSAVLKSTFGEEE